MKMYEITQDIKALNDLFENAVDENGEPRELNEAEKAYLNECAFKSREDFDAKFENYCKLMANYKANADAAAATKKAMKDEYDRLGARAKAYENRRDALKNWLFFNMNTLQIEKYKTALFSANIQNTPMSIRCASVGASIPERFLKPRELDTTKIKEAIKLGSIKVVDGELSYNGEQLDGVHAETGKTLVIR